MLLRARAALCNATGKKELGEKDDCVDEIYMFANDEDLALIREPETES